VYSVIVAGTDGVDHEYWVVRDGRVPVSRYLALFSSDHTSRSRRSESGPVAAKLARRSSQASQSL
jgi:hypothetical protein